MSVVGVFSLKSNISTLDVWSTDCYGKGMLSILLVWILTSVALIITSYVVPGFKISGFGAAMIASVVIGLFNAILRPILLFLTLPINILTLGLFTFVVNAIVLKLAASLLSGFEIDGWGSAIIGAVVLSLVHLVIFSIAPKIV
jgi:putative membrane protein